MNAIDLQTEYINNPLGLDETCPCFSWKLEADAYANFQSGYRILVSTFYEQLMSLAPDMWDSGKVETDKTVGVQYNGNLLKSQTRYYWRVGIWNLGGNECCWSEPAWFEMGLYSADEWKGQWICRKEREADIQNAPLFRKQFSIMKAVQSARAYIAGLGYFEMHINGKRVGDHVLDPGFTRYDRTILYVTHDVTQLFSIGNNTVCMELGRGFYSITTKSWFELDNAQWHDEPKFLLQIQLCYKDGTCDVFVSDESWKTTGGPILFDSVHAGEIYDARHEKEQWMENTYEDDHWEYAVPAQKPLGKLSAQLLPPIRAIEAMKPQKVDCPCPEIYVYKFPCNVTGWVALHAAGSNGKKLVIKYGEKLLHNGRVSVESEHIYCPIQIDTYYFKGQSVETWEPKFSYKGFQYVEMQGLDRCPRLEDVEAIIIHTDVERTGRFSCGNKLLNQIHNASIRTILNNLHSIPTDTPVYEKNGWTGDGNLIAESAIFNFNMLQFFRKWMNDYQDCQREDGLIPLIVPGAGWGMEHSPEWGSAYIFIPWNLYRYYEDQSILLRQYKGMKAYVEYSISRLQQHIGPSVLGDWMAPGKFGLPPEGSSISATAYTYLTLKIFSQIATVCDVAKDSIRYANAAAEILTAFNERFFDRDRQIYRISTEEYRQTSNTLPLAFGMVPASVKKMVALHLVEDVRKKGGHLDTGILGTKFLLQVLTESGYIDDAYRIATQKSYPSWGFWIENGATTLWENWELEGRSRNHFMFGTIEEWFYKYLAGIEPLSPGFKNIRIRPYFPESLDYVDASYCSVRGNISSSWKKQGEGQLCLEVEIPANTVAEIHVPQNLVLEDRIEENGICENRHLVFLRMENDRAVFAAHCGKYNFK